MNLFNHRRQSCLHNHETSIMNRTLLAFACLAFPIAALAADPTQAPPAPASSASAPALKPSKIDSRAAVRASKDRVRLSGECRGHADQAQLENVERRQFMAACMNGKPSPNR